MVKCSFCHHHNICQGFVNLFIFSLLAVLFPKVFDNMTLCVWDRGHNDDNYLYMQGIMIMINICYMQGIMMMINIDDDKYLA